MFITFEGVEGSGKTTQRKLLTEKLESIGKSVVLTREPGGTEIGTQVRKILLDSKNSAMVPLCELLLYFADRAQHVEEVVKPGLKAGKIVLCDRFVDSTIVYQGAGRGVGKQDVLDLKDLVLKDLKPDLTIIFDLDAEKGLDRAKTRIAAITEGDKEDRFENEELEFHKRIRNGFLELAKQEPERFAVVDASLTPEEIFENVWKIVEQRMV